MRNRAPLANHDGDGNKDVAKQKRAEQYFSTCVLRANVNMTQTNSGKSPRFVSLLLSYFVAQYVLMWCNFLVKIYFSFGEMIFFVRPLKYANFHREYYPSCVTSCNEFDLRYFCQHNPLFYHLNLRWSSTHILKIFNINWVQFMMVPLETSSKSAANCTSD